MDLNKKEKEGRGRLSDDASEEGFPSLFCLCVTGVIGVVVTLLLVFFFSTLK